MAKINSRFVHYNTLASFNKQKNGDGFDDECIVFIKEGKLIYTHDTLYQTLSADDYSKVQDLVIKKTGETITAGDNSSVPSSGLMLNYINGKTNFVGVANSYYSKYSDLPTKDISNGTYLIGANSSGTTGSYTVTASGNTFVEQSQVKRDQNTVYIAKDGTVYKSNGNAWTLSGQLPVYDYDVCQAMYEKLLDIEEGANKTVVDEAPSETSENPVQNKAITEELRAVEQCVIENTNKLKNIEDGATKTVIDSEFSETSTNPIQNGVLTKFLQVVEYAISTANAKLNGIDEGANKYVLPTASKTVMGGVKIGNGINVSNGTISVTIPSSFKPVILDMASGKESTNFSNYMSGVSGPGYNGYACVLLNGTSYIGMGSIYANSGSSAEIFVVEKGAKKHYTMSGSGEIIDVN